MSNNHERQRKFAAAELELFRKFSGTLNNEIEKSFKYDYQDLQSDIQKLKVELAETQKAEAREGGRGGRGWRGRGGAGAADCHSERDRADK